MPAYELREHQTNGYDVLGRYASPDAARQREYELIAEDRQRLGRYTIDYVQEATPDVPIPVVEVRPPAVQRVEPRKP